MKSIHLLLLVFLGTLFACGGGKDIAATQRAVPEWVNSRPLDPAYYIGIGSASKRLDPMNFAESAKKNAMNAMASEIKVNVRSESFLNTMQVNMQVQEAYNQTIATTTNADLEGFEVVDIYETPEDYFVFYRLSKSTHESIHRAKKTSAMQSAYDQLQQARVQRDRGSIALASDLYLHGLFALKEYWNEANPWNDGANQIFLDNTLYSEFRQMINEVELFCSVPQIALNAGNEFSRDVVISAVYKGKPVAGLGLIYSYDKGRMRNQFNADTDMDGQVSLRIEDINLANAGNQLNVRVNALQFQPADLERRLVEPMLESIRSAPLIIPIATEMPIVQLQLEEKNLGKLLNTERLAAPLRDKMNARGLRFALGNANPDYLLVVRGDTREGGTSQGFHVAYLDFQIVLKDKNGKIVYQRSESNVKGLQLNSEAAGLESYKNAIRLIEREIADQLIDAIF